MFWVHILLKSNLENFEHYFTSVWDECNCVVVWAFFGIAFLWVGIKTDLFQSCDHCWVFQICWHIECSIFTASSFRIGNSSTGIPSPPLALFIVMLPKAHLTSHSRMSGSRWVTTPLWLSGLWRSVLYSSSVYSRHLFLISGEGNGNSIQFSCLKNPMDRGAWWAAVHRVAQSRTRLKRQHACLHWRRKWQPTPVLLPGESQRWRSLVSCCLWGRTESDTTEVT